MAIFKRNTPGAQPTVTVRPIVVQPADLPGFAQRIDAVLRAIGGSDPAIRGSIQGLSESVGGIDPLGPEMFSLNAEAFREELHRPWRWFDKACSLANEQGDYALSPRVYMFCNWFKRVIEPRMTPGDSSDFRLSSVSDDAYAGIARAAAEALSHFPDDHVVAQTSTEVVYAGQLRADLLAGR